MFGVTPIADIGLALPHPGSHHVEAILLLDLEHRPGLDSHRPVADVPIPTSMSRLLHPGAASVGHYSDRHRSLYHGDCHIPSRIEVSLAIRAVSNLCNINHPPLGVSEIAAVVSCESLTRVPLSPRSSKGCAR